MKLRTARAEHPGINGTQAATPPSIGYARGPAKGRHGIASRPRCGFIAPGVYADRGCRSHPRYGNPVHGLRGELRLEPPRAALLSLAPTLVLPSSPIRPCSPSTSIWSTFRHTQDSESLNAHSQYHFATHSCLPAHWHTPLDTILIASCTAWRRRSSSSLTSTLAMSSRTASFRRHRPAPTVVHARPHGSMQSKVYATPQNGRP